MSGQSAFLYTQWPQPLVASIEQVETNSHSTSVTATRTVHLYTRHDANGSGNVLFLDVPMFMSRFTGTHNVLCVHVVTSTC